MREHASSPHQFWRCLSCRTKPMYHGFIGIDLVARLATQRHHHPLRLSIRWKCQRSHCSRLQYLVRSFSLLLVGPYPNRDHRAAVTLSLPSPTSKFSTICGRQTSCMIAPLRGGVATPSAVDAALRNDKEMTVIKMLDYRCEPSDATLSYAAVQTVPPRWSTRRLRVRSFVTVSRIDFADLCSYYCSGYKRFYLMGLHSQRMRLHLCLSLFCLPIIRRRVEFGSAFAGMDKPRMTVRNSNMTTLFLQFYVVWGTTMIARVVSSRPGPSVYVTLQQTSAIRSINKLIAVHMNDKRKIKNSVQSDSERK